MQQRFEFRITAGAIIEKDGKILVVRELLSKKDPQGPTVITQPAGHVEEGESIIDGVIREVLEETGYTIRPTALIGTYLNRFNDGSAMRFSFTAELVDKPQIGIVDEDVLEAVWLPIEEVKNLRQTYRRGSSQITFDDYFAGKRYPLELLHYFDQREDI